MKRQNQNSPSVSRPDVVGGNQTLALVSVFCYGCMFALLCLF